MILVTGGTGLIGSRLIYDLVKAGDEVRAIRRKTSGMHVLNRFFRGQEQLLQRIEWVEGDVTDLFSLEDAMQGVSRVYHCAALVSFHPTDVNRLMKINADGTANMVNAAMNAGVDNFCHVSSSAALGRSEQNVLLTENSFWKTSKYNSGYAISKYSAEREVWRGMEEGLKAFIVNPTIVFGPGDWNTGSTALFGEVMKGLKFYTEGTSGFVDVRDVTKCMIHLMEKGIVGERYILNSENCSYHDVINRIADCFGKSRPTIPVGKILTEIGWRAEMFRRMFSKTKTMITKETARNGQLHWNYSNEKIKNELGIDFIPVEESIRNTCEFLLGEFKAKKVA